MCGRAAQSLSIVQAAAKSFHVVDVNKIIPTTNNNTTTTTNENGAATGTNATTATANTATTTSQHNQQLSSSASSSSRQTSKSTTISTSNNTPNENEYDTTILDIDDHDIDDDDHHNLDRTEYVSRDNYNMSPGMDAIVFWMNHTTNQIQMKRMVWGILPRNGTMNIPLEKGMGKHFTSLMFNARSDTLYEKPTFNNLSKNKQSCIIAMDGFYEWKTEMGRKQPYFVYRNNRNDTVTKHSYLLMAGLWKTVATGWDDQPIIDTFTIITTEVCEPLKWLHSRMPVVIWNNQLAIQWLQQPSINVHTQLVQDAQQTKVNQFQWHPVTPSMSSMKFRSIDAMKPIPKQKTVKSFFTKSTTSTASSNKTNQKDNTDQKKQVNNVSESPFTTKKANIVSMSMNSNTSSNETSSQLSSVTRARVNQTTNNDKKRKATATTMPTKTTAAKSNKKQQNQKVSSASPHRKIDSFFTPKSTSK